MPKTDPLPCSGEKSDLREHRNEMTPYAIGAWGRASPWGQEERKRNLERGIVW